MIKKSGYPVEEHFVRTEDGYILTLHRIPGKEGSPVVLLQHALLESSFCWIINGKERSLGK
jgi:lysosomal acid lipase/cholesteryl ester hydrolase